MEDRDVGQMQKAMNYVLQQLEEISVRRGLHIEIAGIIVRDNCLQQIHAAEMSLLDDIAKGGPIIGLGSYRSMHTTMMGINNALAMHDIPGLHPFEISKFLLDTIADYCSISKEEVVQHYPDMIRLMIANPELQEEHAFEGGVESVKARYN